MDGYSSEESQSAPLLKVVGPTSQLAAAGNNTPLRKRRAASQPTVPPPAASPHAPNRFRSSLPALERSEPKSVAVVSDESDDQSVFSGSLSMVPSWLVSMVLHLVLLLVLAFLGFRPGYSNRQVVLEFAESAAVEMESTEIELEAIAVDELVELESLEQIQTESDSIEMEFPTIPMEMLEFVDLKSVFVSGEEVIENLDKEFGLGVGQGIGNGVGEKSAGGAGAKFFGVGSSGSRFVFVIDCSGSMAGRRWYRAVKELNAAIDELDIDQEFLVLLYNSGTRVMLNRSLEQARLVRATEENKVDCRRWLRGQRTGGGTFPSEAMFAALRLNPDAIFLLSDGQLQDRTERLLPFWNVEVYEPEPRSKIPIHTISLGGGHRGQEILQVIAEQNDGKFTLGN